jgi:hypothetical protein
LRQRVFPQMNTDKHRFCTRSGPSVFIGVHPWKISVVSSAALI